MKYIIRFALLSVVVFMFSCKKDNIIETATQVGRSKVTFYVVLTLKGPSVQSIVVNQPYVDSGATAVENGKPTTFTTAGTVDNTTVGIYTLTYTSVNQDGYPSSVTRIVAVIPTAPNPAVDLSGSYANTGSVALTANIMMVAPGVYYTDNCWGGGSSAVIPAYFFSSDGVALTVPTQKFSAYGTLDGSGTYSAGLISWTITLEDQGPFTAVKSWQKQ